MMPLAAIGKSFWDAVAKPAGPPNRSLPSMRISSVTNRSAGLLSSNDSYNHQRNGPVLLRVGLIMFGFSANTSSQYPIQ